MTVHIENGDCLELMAKLPDKSVDLFICDLPYGETNCKWDSKIDLDKFWLEFKRLRKSNRVACIHFCSTKFGYTLIKSNPTMFKMDMVWKKRNKTGGLQSRLRPMRNHEMVYFFYEQSPKYNRDKYHKRIKAKPKMKKVDGGVMGIEIDDGDTPKFHMTQDSTVNSFEPKLPSSVIERDDRINENNKCAHGWDINYMDKPRVKHFDPALPTSIVEEKGFGPLYGSDVKNICNSNQFIPPNPGSVVEETCSGAEFGWETHKLPQENRGNEGYNPRLPVSVLEETDQEKYTDEFLKNNKAGANTNCFQHIFSKENLKKHKEKNGVGFEPPNPVSVLEEKKLSDKEKSVEGWEMSEMSKYKKENRDFGKFIPANPSSVLEEDGEKNAVWGYDKTDAFVNYDEGGFDPKLPCSMFESGKVFVGKRNHQTEKPIDILEFFLKYYSDEGDTILDPTMGSGSAGVACAKLNRNFIGFELTEKYFEVAKNRIQNKK